MNTVSNLYQLPQQFQALDQAIYNLWRLYGYSEPYWGLENARIKFEAHAREIERAQIHAKQ